MVASKWEVEIYLWVGQPAVLNIVSLLAGCSMYANQSQKDFFSAFGTLIQVRESPAGDSLS
ncbi:hypothetical protein CSQ88_08980 [Iodobacter sp. BJB302]|nr:hypothetical protein CSQ88_08980 [Iodobacter sp. BJB302]